MWDNLTVNGFHFDSAAEYAEAKKEFEAIEYICSKMDVNNPETAFKVYYKLLERKNLHTIVGYSFLKELVTNNYTSYGIGATDFFTGKVGMYLSSGWTIPTLDHEYPTTFPNRDSWGLLPYPKDVVAASANGSWSFAIGNNARKNKAPVVTLLKYLTKCLTSTDCPPY